MENRGKTLKILLVCLIVWIGIMAVLFSLIPESKNNNTSKEKALTFSGTRTEAIIMSQQFVKQRLKTPKVAEFQNAAGAISLPHDRNPHRFTVLSYVDSQNSFGAMIRTRYRCDLEYQPSDDKWKLIDLRIN